MNKYENRVRGNEEGDSCTIGKTIREALLTRETFRTHLKRKESKPSDL